CIHKGIVSLALDLGDSLTLHVDSPPSTSAADCLTSPLNQSQCVRSSRRIADKPDLIQDRSAGYHFPIKRTAFKDSKDCFSLQPDSCIAVVVERPAQAADIQINFHSAPDLLFHHSSR
ncbi:MAG: hypothetical protein ACYDDV_01000, partial [Methanoregula sp.]